MSHGYQTHELSCKLIRVYISITHDRVDSLVKLNFWVNSVDSDTDSVNLPKLASLSPSRQVQKKAQNDPHNHVALRVNCCHLARHRLDSSLVTVSPLHVSSRCSINTRWSSSGFACLTFISSRLVAISLRLASWVFAGSILRVGFPWVSEFLKISLFLF